jgi:hypothetical protein
MPGYLATRDASESDYEAIELAVMETDRGRWFLSEYARRNRHADTEVLLTSLVRIERSISLQREPTEIDKFRLDVLEMSRAIARTRAEIAAIKPPEGDGRLVEASGELDSIVSTTESATSEILAAAEKVQEVAWTLREANADIAACDKLDQHSVAIYTACSFQDLTAQRTRKVIEILGFLEKRVNAMADIWQFADEGREDEKVIDPQAGLAVDPTMSQADVDFVLVDQEIEKADFEIEMPAMGPQQADLDLAAMSAPDATVLLDVSDHLPESGSETSDNAAGAIDRALPEHSASLVVAAETTYGPADFAEVGDPLHMDRDSQIDDILFSGPAPVQQPAPADGSARLQLVEPTPDALFAKARTGKELSVEEAAKALDALKNMSVEERTRLFS